jgi:hypothetical protein
MWRLPLPEGGAVRIGLEIAIILFAILVMGYQTMTRSWEYRAVYHYDCASYLTES